MPKQPLKLLSCNIEGDRHLEARLLPFFLREKADVLLLQEVLEPDLERIARVANLDYRFVPMCHITQKSVHFDRLGKLGVAIFAKNIKSWQADYYFGSAASLPEFYANQAANSMNRLLLSAQVAAGGAIFNLATTHFTWSGDATVVPEQERDFKTLSKILDKFDDLILTGDFNTPRGGAIFDALCARYRDNIPQNIKTTIDRNLHKSGKDIQLVVDALFSTAQYLVSEVEVLNGTSDHQAILARVARRSEGELALGD